MSTTGTATALEEVRRRLRDARRKTDRSALLEGVLLSLVWGATVLLAPNTAPNASNFNWGSTLANTNWMIGVAADWPLMPRLIMKASAIIGNNDGSADFQPQTLASGSPAANLPPINTYDNTTRTSFVLRAVWLADKNWELSGGYAYERYKYDDLQFENYQYVVGTGTTTSYLSGMYAFQDYKANILFGTVRYKF